MFIYFKFLIEITNRMVLDHHQQSGTTRNLFQPQYGTSSEARIHNPARGIQTHDQSVSRVNAYSLEH